MSPDRIHLAESATTRPMVGERYEVDDVVEWDQDFTVYHGMDSVSGTPIVVAVPRTLRRRSNSAALARLKKQSGILAHLRRPELCNLIEAYHGEPHPYFVFERPAGLPLREYLSRRSKLGFDELCTLMTRFVLATGHIHSAGLVHGNISLDTMYVDGADLRAPKIKLSKMQGCVRKGDIRGASMIPTEGSLLISATVLRPPRADPREDVSALGGLFDFIVRNHVRGGESSPEPLVELFQQCVSVDIDQRPADANVLLDAFLSRVRRVRETDRDGRHRSVIVSGSLGHTHDASSPDIPTTQHPRATALSASTVTAARPLGRAHDPTPAPAPSASLTQRPKAVARTEMFGAAGMAVLLAFGLSRLLDTHDPPEPAATGQSVVTQPVAPAGIANAGHGPPDVAQGQPRIAALPSEVTPPTVAEAVAPVGELPKENAQPDTPSAPAERRTIKRRAELKRQSSRRLAQHRTARQRDGSESPRSTRETAFLSPPSPPKRPKATHRFLGV